VKKFCDMIEQARPQVRIHPHELHHRSPRPNEFGPTKQGPTVLQGLKEAAS
jgi:hypothetical protein